MVFPTNGSAGVNHISFVQGKKQELLPILLVSTQKKNMRPGFIGFFRKMACVSELY
jgi:hypothetical protein